MPYEISLQSLLKTRDENLYGRLIHIGDTAKTLLSYTQGKFPFYTPHDFYHSTTVQENLDWIIPDSLKDDLNTYEIFLLLVAAWLHDWGMIGEEGEDPLIIRENHHARTEMYFERLYEKIGLSLHEALIAGRISKGHRKEDLYSTEYDDMTFRQGIRIRTRLLSAVLRMADEMDVTHSRTPEVIYYTINPTGKSEEEFKKHLSITGIGQLDVPHKVYLNGIAYDPMGAKAIRELQSKIQKELNNVKGILSQYGIQLDTIELRLEPRGFVDKPIGFEVDRRKIVDLFIGKQLYGKPDAAIRELVQNAVDSCNVRCKNVIGYEPEILIEKKNNIIAIQDNGTGMGFSEAKRFLSKIGSSFYSSEDFQDTVKNKPYDPISSFGVGLLSSFLIADKLIIDTKKEDDEACLFTISAVDQEWKYEKSSRSNPGTSVTLHLNDIGKDIDLEETLRRYFICLDVPVAYRDGESNLKTLSNIWSSDEIVSRFLKGDFSEPKSVKVINQLTSDNYDVIFVHTNDYFSEPVVLFNHGIFVNQFTVDALDNSYCLLVNLKKNLVDLHISREDVIQNSKWFGLMHDIFNALLNKLLEYGKDNGLEKSIKQIANIIEDRMWIHESQSEIDFFNRHPFLHSFFKLAPFPVLIKDKIEYYSLAEIVENKEIIVYKCASLDFEKEVDLFKCNSLNKNVVFNPYTLPFVGDFKKMHEVVDLFQYLVELRGKIYRKNDLRTLLLDVAKYDETDYSDIAPPNVRFATFESFKPLVVVSEYAVVNKCEPYFGRAYWGNILLFWELLDSNRRDKYKEILSNSVGERYKSIQLLSPPMVLLDSSDDFISVILDKKQVIDKPCKKLLNKYFKYIAFLPLVIHDISSCLVFIESIDSLEEQIASALSIDRPDSFLNRLKPDARLYIEYYKKYGAEYIEAEHN